MTDLNVGNDSKMVNGYVMTNKGLRMVNLGLSANSVPPNPLDDHQWLQLGV